MKQRLRNFLSAVSPSKTFLFFASIFLLSLVLLTVFRIGFLMNHHLLAKGIPLGTLAKSFLIGARFDMVVLSYLLIPLFLLSHIPFAGIDRSKAARMVVIILFLLFMGLFFFLSLIDIEYFGEFGTRLSRWVWEYMDHPDMVWYSMWSAYPVALYFLLLGAVTFVFSTFVIRISRRIFERKQMEGFIRQLVYFVLGAGMLFLGARGRTQVAPIDWGVAYFSPYGFANQLALNGVYTLGKSWWEDNREERGEILKRYHFYPSSEALSTVQRLLYNPREKLTDSLHSLERWYYPDPDSLKAKDYNVVIILLESWLARYVGALSGKPDATPNFDSLAQRGVLFEHFFATGTRTNRGIVSVLCSYPSQAGRSVMRRYSINHASTSIVEILKNRGYQNILVYGGDLQFDNMEGFLRGQGFEKLTRQEDFPSGSKLGKWGVPDHLTYERANEEFNKFSEKPFLGVIVTVSNHEPYLIPSDSFKVFGVDVSQSNYLNSFYYSDWALGQFFRQAEKQPYFKNTIFVLVADHGKFMETQTELPADRFHIACLIYAPYILGASPRRISTVASQTDLIPTILGILGKPSHHQSWGRDILSLSKDDKGFALMMDGPTVGWMEGYNFLVERIGVSCSLYDTSKDPRQKYNLSITYPDTLKAMQTKERSFLQLSTEMMAGQKILVP
jgi:phosphoglycerol transferase MdoB-like AlkP superfamily enzyme